MLSRSRTAKASDAIVEADGRAIKAVAPFRKSPTVQAISKVGKLGDQPELRILSAAIITAGLVGGDRRLSRAGFRMLVAHELATLAKDFAKDRVDRTRPRSANSAAERRIRKGSDPSKEESSFPSGHSAGAMAVASAFAREYPDRGAAALGAAGVIAAAQVPRHAHYVSDVGAGIVLGLAAEAASNFLWDTVARKDWLGRQDSNLRMPVPKTGALPLGDAPARAPMTTAEMARL
jgi:membrane-associated phospholipid phosphatase